MARNSAPVPDPEDLRKDLLAALAAGRELGPEMDSAIVDAHLRRHYQNAPAQQPRAVVERQPVDLSAFLAPLGMVLTVAAFIAILYFSHGALWFLFWPLMAWGWWGRRRWSGSGPDRMQEREARYRERMAYREQRWRERNGLPLDGGHTPLSSGPSVSHDIV